jgi:Uma2 family endonuclease
MATRTMMTLEQYLALPDDGCRHEYNRGVLIKVPAAKHGHGRIIANLIASLDPLVRQTGLGRVYGQEGFELDAPDLIRIPDVAFVRMEREQATGDNEWLQGAPDLAVEVVSPSNDPEDLAEKIEQYLEFGAREVWIVYPRNRQVQVHTPGDGWRVLRSGDALSSPMFPNWQLTVDELFA